VLRKSSCTSTGIISTLTKTLCARTTSTWFLAGRPRSRASEPQRGRSADTERHVPLRWRRFRTRCVDQIPDIPGHTGIFSGYPRVARVCPPPRNRSRRRILPEVVRPGLALTRGGTRQSPVGLHIHVVHADVHCIKVVLFTFF